MSFTMFKKYIYFVLCFFSFFIKQKYPICTLKTELYLLEINKHILYLSTSADVCVCVCLRVCCWLLFSKKFWKFHTLTATIWLVNGFSMGFMVKRQTQNWHRFQAAPAIQNVPLFIPYLINYQSFSMLLLLLLFLLAYYFCLVALLGRSMLLLRSIQTNLLILILSHKMITASKTGALARVIVSFIMLFDGWHHFLCLFLLNFDHICVSHVLFFFLNFIRG